MGEINNIMMLVVISLFTGIIVIQPTEIQRENNKGFTNSVQFRSNIFYQNRDNSTRNKLNQNLVFPITSFSCWVLRDYCGTIRSTLLSADVCWITFVFLSPPRHNWQHSRTWACPSGRWGSGEVAHHRCYVFITTEWTQACWCRECWVGKESNIKLQRLQHSNNSFSQGLLISIDSQNDCFGKYEGPASKEDGCF